MAIYTAIVMETVTTERRYTIDADTQEEANEKAAVGDTIGEEDIKNHGVNNRDVMTVDVAEKQEEEVS